MTPGRKILAVTGLVVAALAVVFMVVGWRTASAVAPAIAALAAVSGVGVTAWATFARATQSKPTTKRLTVSDTGTIKTDGAAEGVTGAALGDRPAPDEVIVRRTGSIEGGGGVTGYRQE
ncbi:hypothetical protein [Actinoplanes solisilvae]|uniref:hypothetical protein n=1 Tax=Actinoplanes solisilvae TaxID=2486853 RepID=UPI000FD8FD7E|nr:hypothetical protein [Actinoplanes solisilvae]